MFDHEQEYRTPELMGRLQNFPIAICGAGALGANLAENLARSGFGTLRVIDRDRVEERNLSTQPYYKSDIGAYKAKILANSLYRALGVAIEAKTADLNPENSSKLLSKTGLVVDTFDNSTARQAVKDYCQRANLPCLHAGLAGDYGEVIWNESYRVPSAVNDDVCDYPLARNLVFLVVAIASEVIVQFVATEARPSYTVTLSDFAVKSF